jgi:DNA-binding response OmpR family regulator
VKRLRGKIHDDGESLVIRSIRGVGYIMREPEEHDDEGSGE